MARRDHPFGRGWRLLRSRGFRACSGLPGDTATRARVAPFRCESFHRVVRVALPAIQGHEATLPAAADELARCIAAVPVRLVDEQEEQDVGDGRVASEVRLN